MSDDKFGGLSLEDIMAAAMSGFDDETESKSDSGKKSDSTSGGTNDIDLDRIITKGSGSIINTGSDSIVDTGSGSIVDTGLGSIVDTGSGSIPETGTGHSDGGDVFVSNFQNTLTGEALDTFNRIFDLSDNGRTVEAVQLAQMLVNENISNEFAWYACGYAQDKEKNTAEAIKCYKQAVAINASFAIAHLELAQLYYDQEEIDLAKFHAETTVKLDYSLNQAKAILCDITKVNEGLDVAIDRLQNYIDKAEVKTELQNYLGTYYVEKAYEFVFDIPDRPFFDPMTKALKLQKGIVDDDDVDTFPGFISKYDIADARMYANKALGYLTLDNPFINDYRDLCNQLIEQCEIDEELLPLSNEKFIKVYQVLLGVFHFLIAFCTWGIGLPLLVGAAIVKKANLVPGYIMNYMLFFNSETPLDFKERDTREKIDKHPFIKDMLLDHSKNKKENAVMSLLGSLQNDGLFTFLGKEILHYHMYFLKCRLAFYKRYIEMKKAQKKQRDSASNIITNSNEN